MKTFKNCGLVLAMAAALTMTMTGCTSENELVFADLLVTY